MPKQNHFAAITTQIVGLLQSQLEGWRKPWVYLGEDRKRAHNLKTGTTYRGINQLLLSLVAHELEHPYNQWITFKQASDLGARIRKGERATRIYFFDLLYIRKDKVKLTKVEFEALSQEARNEIRRVGYLKCFFVFNRSQVDGLPPPADDSTKSLEREIGNNQRAEKLLLQSGADIKHKAIDEAYYSLRDDSITLPERSYFEDLEGFYATAFHELGHWTGHPTRLDRKLGFPRKSSEYAYEELVAELASAFVCAELGYEKQICQNAAYINSWLKHLESDQTFIWRAARNAEAAAKYIMTPRSLEEPST